MALQWLSGEVKDWAGRAIQDATVTVSRIGGTLTMFKDVDGLQPIAGNTLRTNRYGKWFCFVADGRYQAQTTYQTLAGTMTYSDGPFTLGLGDWVPPVPDQWSAAYFGFHDDGVTLDVSAYMDWHNAIRNLNAGNGTGTIKLPRQVVLADILHHPAVNISGQSRGGSEILTAAGAVTAAIIVIPRTQGPAEGDAWRPYFEHLQLAGRKALQVSGDTLNPIRGFYFPNPDPAANPTFGDPAYTSDLKKGYNSARFEDVEIGGCAGTGVDVEAGRPKFFFVDSRTINCEGNGTLVKSNDPYVGPRTGFGGNKKHQLAFQGGSGVLVDGANTWGSGSARSRDCLSIFVRATKGGVIRGCMLNDTVLLSGTGDKDENDFLLTGNLHKPHDEAFTADGVVLDVDPDENFSTNAAIIVSQYNGVVIGPSTFTRTTPTTFPTEGNSNGATGTAFQHLVRAVSSSEVGFTGAAASKPGGRPWTSADALPLYCDESAGLAYDFQDIHTGRHMKGGLGKYRNASRVELAVAPDEVASEDRTLTVGGKKPAEFLGKVIVDSTLVETGAAVQRIALTNGGSWNLTSAVTNVIASKATGGTTAGATFRLGPAPLPDQRLKLQLLTPVIGLVINLGGERQQFAPNTVLPSSTGALAVLEFQWITSTADPAFDGAWWFVGYSQSP